MNLIFLSAARRMWLVFVLFSPLFAMGQAITTQPEPAKGEMLFNTGDMTRNVIACVTCHGVSGAGSEAQPENPRLAAQHGTYLHQQLVNFQTGARSHPIMAMIVKEMTAEEIRNVTAWLSALPPAFSDKTSDEKQDSIRNEPGRRIFHGGIAARHVPACAACHGAGGAGVPPHFPRLAGQQPAYTEAQLRAFHSGARNNDPQMRQIAKRMTEEEIKAVARYIATLR